jgi:hypothetical protein
MLADKALDSMSILKEDLNYFVKKGSLLDSQAGS